MIYLSKIRSCVLGLVMVLACGAEPAAASGSLTFLYDAPLASVVHLSEQQMSQKSGWSRLEEDDTAHRDRCRMPTKASITTPTGKNRISNTMSSTAFLDIRSNV